MAYENRLATTKAIPFATAGTGNIVVIKENATATCSPVTMTPDNPNFNALKIIERSECSLLGAKMSNDRHPEWKVHPTEKMPFEAEYGAKT